MAKIPGFFERIASCFPSLKKGPTEAALNKSADRAGSEILNGLRDNNFKKVHQGLKRLHNAGNKSSNSNYVPDKINEITDKLRGNDAAVKNLSTFAKMEDDQNLLVGQYSDLNKFFHRVLKGLKNIGLVRERYVNARTDRIDALDKKIETSLLEMRVGLPNNDADAGLPSAMYHLGIRYRDGVNVGGVDVVGKDPVKAALLLQKAVDRGDGHPEAKDALEQLIGGATPETLYELGIRYRDGVNVGGVDVGKDPVKAALLFQKAVDRGDGHPEAKTALEEMEELFREPTPEILCELGKHYRDGVDVGKDRVVAALLFQIAEERGDGHPEAKTALRELIREATPETLYKLGVAYRDGLDVGKNLETAASLFRQAADRGSRLALSALYKLGQRYRDGKGVEQNLEKAASLFLQAANRGSSDAMYQLGLCYRDGSGVDKKPQEAISWFRRAADAGHVEAMYQLGLCYLGLYYRDGSGVDKKLQEAISWFRRADDAGHVEAKHQIVLCHALSLGVDKNPQEAITPFSLRDLD